MMSDARKLELSIHHSNFFHPKPLGITNIAEYKDGDYIAVTKEYLHTEELNTPLTVIEIYKIGPEKAANLIQTIFEYERITGICWICKRKIVTVSRDQTINVYCIKRGAKICSLITDYGPIRCMDMMIQDNILITGTDYGYIAIYKISRSGKTVEPVSKMVKINNCIESVAHSISTRELRQVAEAKSPIRPGKRKRSESSEESDEEVNDKETSPVDFLDSHDITIYGACKNEVVAWDYHKKVVVETMRIGDESCRVNAVLSLENGDIVLGDSTGTLSIFDHNTFTCRQSTSILQSEILCLAKDSKGKRILVSGKDPTIVVLKRSKTSSDEYVLFEKIDIHIHDVTTLLMTKRDELFSGALDGFLARFKLKGGKKTLHKTITLPHYTSHIMLFKEELLIKYEKSLVLWKLPKTDLSGMQNGGADQLSPVKLLLLKAKTFIHAASFCDQWIAYSTRRGVHIFNRLENKLVSHRPARKLPNCSILEFCYDTNQLVAASGPALHLIDLSKKSSSEDDVPQCTVLPDTIVGSSVRHIIYVPSMNMIAVACGPSKNTLYTFQITSEPAQPLKKITKMNFMDDEISFTAQNRFESKDSSFLYVYTNRDKLIKVDLASSNNPKQAFSSSNDPVNVKGLPRDANILGMVMITSDQCILYDNHRMFKLDLNSMEVLNQVSNYDYIIKLDNLVFNKTDQVALVELTPEDYRKTLPITQHRRKFGQ